MLDNRVLIPPALSPRLLAASLRGDLASASGESIGTTWSVQALHDGELRLVEIVERVLADIIRQMSTWAPTSDLMRFNRAPAGAWCTLPPSCMEVLRFALALARATQGAYDPTIGSLVNLWGFGAPGPRSGMPTDDEIARARANAGWSRIGETLDGSRLQQPGGVEIDLSSIAKGYAVDQVARALEAVGVDHYLVEIGGESRGAGCKADGSPWWVELETAAWRAPQRLLVALHEQSIATSGDYRRHFDCNGVRCSHTIDPRTGRPIANDLIAVTVLADECMHADALATALQVLGLEAGLLFAHEHDVAALLVRRDGRGGFVEHFTPALLPYLH